MKNECHCVAEKVATIAVAEYNNRNQLEVTNLDVCDTCFKINQDLGLILTDDKIKKYFG
jgi:hypothetical protein